MGNYHYDTFDDYCRERWGFNSSRARQLIAAAKTAETVTTGNTLTTERHARELARVPEDQRQAVLDWATEKSGGKPYRRHLDESQRGMIGARILEHYRREAKERQKLSEGRGKKGPINLPDLKGDSRDKAGAAVNVSGTTRRHMTPSQLAMAADKAREFYDRQAKERQRGGQGGKLLPVNLPEAKSDARDAAGKALGISGRMTKHSRFLASGSPAWASAKT